MKNVIIYTIVALAGISFASAQTSQFLSTADDNSIKQIELRGTVADALVGSLICSDSKGVLKLCSGDEFDKVMGFTFTAPYVTPNKPKLPTDAKDEFVGIASNSNGDIKEGDYVCACSVNKGAVRKCNATDKPYAKAMSGGTNGQLIKVRVLPQNR